MSPPPLITLEDVTFAPEGQQVLSGLSFSADERRIGIVGRNGSGKTSLARVMAGLVPPTQGKVRIGGVDVAKDRKAALGLVGILFQNPDHQIIFPTVAEEISFGLTQMGLSRKQAATQVDALLKRFGKDHWGDAAIHRLSQGQRQLVCLLSVIAMAPKLIILDEPFAGLDIPTTRQLARFLDALDVSVVQITHTPDAVRSYDRVLWVEGGRILRDGPAASVLADFTRAMQQMGDGDDLTDLAG